MTDEELIARLRGVTIKQHSYGAYTLVPDPLSSSAADRIEALVGETGELWEAEQRGYANAMEAERKLHEDRIEALVAAGKAYREATRHLKPCPETAAGFDAALKGDGHVGT